MRIKGPPVAILGVGILFYLANGERQIVAQASDSIRVAELGERGVVFESTTGYEGMEEARGIGDFDGDGFDDVALAVKMSEGEQRGRWCLIVMYGASSLGGRYRLDGTQPRSLTLCSNNTLIPNDYTRLEQQIAPLGDVNGDGFDDFIAGLPYYGAERDFRPGAAILLHGGPNLLGNAFIEEVGINLPGSFISSTDPEHDALGFGLADAGDFNGDGRRDLAIGARSSDPGGRIGAGIVFILFDPAALPPAADLAEVGSNIPGIEVHGRTIVNADGGLRGEKLGGGLAAAGDVDGDGFGDLLGAAGEPFPGRVYLLRGRSAAEGVLSIEAEVEAGRATVFERPGDNRGLGAQQGQIGIGDLDGDGLGDILLGVTSCCGGLLEDRPEAVVLLFRGRTDWPRSIAVAAPEIPGVTTFHAPGSGRGFGSALASAGDLDADGLPDFLIGAHTESPGGIVGAGEGYAIYGRNDYEADVFLAEGFNGLQVSGESNGNGLGTTVSSAGDFNGDGALDMVFMAYQVTSVYPGPARAYVIYGTGGGRAPLTLLSVEPFSGSVRGGRTVVLRGSGFGPEARVFFGERPAAVTVVSAAEIRVSTPAAALPGPVDVSVTSGGETRVRPGAYEYTQHLPEIDLARLGDRGFRLLGVDPANSVVLSDLTGDGAAEMAVSWPRAEGATVAILRGGPGLPEAIEVEAADTRGRLSRVTSAAGSLDSDVRISGLGDVNGDGIGDLGIGTQDNSAFVLFGRTAFPEAIDIEVEVAAGRAVRLRREEDVAAGNPGVIGPAGDLTGDGIADLALGFPGTILLGAFQEAGEVLLVAGRRVWPEAIAADAPGSHFERVAGTSGSQRLGGRVLGAGDVNGDGLPDLLTANTRPHAQTAITYIIYGGSVGLESDIEALLAAGGAVAIEVEEDYEFQPIAPGDLNGDGFDDVAIGALASGVESRGMTYVIYGAADLPPLMRIRREPTEPDGVVRIIGAASMMQAGQAGPAGDFNSDGFADFVIGAGFPVEDGPGPGSIYLMFGAASLPERIELRRLGGRGLQLLGSVPPPGSLRVDTRSAGDFNGDGADDLAFSETGFLTVVYGFTPRGPFARGDANSDGAINITDGVYVLTYLFLGGAEPLCEDAADADDKGTIRLTDAVYLFNHLFLGGPEPPPPYPGAGVDPTEDELSCFGF